MPLYKNFSGSAAVSEYFQQGVIDDILFGYLSIANRALLMTYSLGI